MRYKGEPFVHYKQKVVRIIHFIYLIIFFLIAACTTSKEGAAGDDGRENAERTTIEEAYDPSFDLTEHLRGIAGVEVLGSGSDARIRVRGMSSVRGTNDPLFIINGQPMSGDYSAIYHAVNPWDIERVSVIKNAAELSMYGLRGANGVVKIKLKE